MCGSPQGGTDAPRDARSTRSFSFFKRSISSALRPAFWRSTCRYSHLTCDTFRSGFGASCYRCKSYVNISCNSCISYMAQYVLQYLNNLNRIPTSSAVFGSKCGRTNIVWLMMVGDFIVYMTNLSVWLMLPQCVVPYLSTYLCISLYHSVYHSLYHSLYLFVSLRISLSVSPSVSPSVFPSVSLCLSLYLSICLSICLSISLSIYIYLYKI